MDVWTYGVGFMLFNAVDRSLHDCEVGEGRCDALRCGAESLTPSLTRSLLYGGDEGRYLWLYDKRE